MKKLKVAILLVTVLSINIVAGTTSKITDNSSKINTLAYSGTIIAGNDGDPWV